MCACLSWPKERIESRIVVPDIIFLKNLSSNSALEPKAEGLSVSVSFVCESKAGFSMSALIKTHMWLFTCSSCPRVQCIACSMRSHSHATYAISLTCNGFEYAGIEPTNSNLYRATTHGSKGYYSSQSGNLQGPQTLHITYTPHIHYIWI